MSATDVSDLAAFLDFETIVDVDSCQAIWPAEATRCVRAATDGGWVFHDNVPIAIAPSPDPFCTVVAAERPELDQDWWSMIVTSQDVSLAGHCLLMQVYPYAADWGGMARFKRAFKGGIADRSRRLQAAEDHPDGPLAYLEQCSVDLFETRKDVVRATCRTPRTSQAGLFSRMNFWGGESRADAEGVKKRRWHWGACEDPEACHQNVYASDLLQKLLRLVDEDAPDWFRYSHARHKSGEPIKTIRLHERTKGMATELLDASIWMAMAGPEKLDADGPGDSSGWPDQPVAQFAARIFGGALNALNRRVVREVTPPSRKQLDLPPEA